MHLIELSQRHLTSHTCDISKEFSTETKSQSHPDHFTFLNNLELEVDKYIYEIFTIGWDSPSPITNSQLSSNEQCCIKYFFGS